MNSYFPDFKTKPVVYKKGNSWYCKSLNCSFEGEGESPNKAFQEFMLIICKGY